MVGETSETPSTWWVVGGILGALGILLGAFGAHGLEQQNTSAESLEHWKTAAWYHQAHSLALLAVAAHPRGPRAAGIAFALGILLFSGSLYALVLTGIKGLGMITPLGGLSLTAGWVLLALASRSRWGRGEP